MQNFKKTFLLIFSIWPTIYFFLFGNYIAMNIISSSGRNWLFLVIHVGHIFMILGMMAVYIYRINNNTTIGGPARTRWVFSILLLSPMSMVYYWFKYVLQS